MKIEHKEKKKGIGRHELTLIFALILSLILGVGGALTYSSSYWIGDGDQWRAGSMRSLGVEKLSRMSKSDDITEGRDSPTESVGDKAVDYEQVRFFCNGKDWEGLARYMDSEGFAPIKQQLAQEQLIEISEERYLAITTKDGFNIVIYGSLNEAGNGAARAVISGDAIYAVYEGEWAGGMPDGYGKVLLWNKGEAYMNAVIMNGELSGGLLTGNTEVTLGDYRKVVFTMEHGSIGETGVDSKGNQYEEISGREDLTIGVPGYGASDCKVMITLRTY